MAEIGSSEEETPTINNGNLICGVVEGFYGLPWTNEQRKDLFQKMKKWQMNSYLYAPKDDCKHRTLWRELYTVEEADHLTSLITSCKEQGIIFYYAVSPGLDITYSSSKEIATLKRKLEQVSQFGCEAFALLFDDIESEMSESDKEVFQSFAHAQVSVSNEIYHHLGQPKFLLCPTQYCAARSVPNVQNSEYLKTIGSKLTLEIDIMWTGARVISRIISVSSIEEVTEVLKRPPVLWDNLHANDYDKNRIFLGPYSGRSPDLMRLIRGVLTNPNCEYGANFVPIHTLAQWSRCSSDSKRELNLNDPVSADIKLETETDDGTVEDIPATLSPSIYHPRRALKNALIEWLQEFKTPRDVIGTMHKVHVMPPVSSTVTAMLPTVNTCMTVSTTTTSTTTVSSTPSQMQSLPDIATEVSTGPIMNSFVSDTKIICSSEEMSDKVETEKSSDGQMSLVDEPDESSVNNGTSMSSSTNAITMDSTTAMDSNNGTSTATIDSNNSTPTVSMNSSNSTPTVTMHSNTSTPSITMESDSNTAITTRDPIVPLDTVNPSSVDNTPAVKMETSSTVDTEPMDCNITPEQSPIHTAVDLSLNDMQEESDSELSLLQLYDKNRNLNTDDLLLICDLFYLPFEHGVQGLQILQEFHWLKSNVHMVIKGKVGPEVQDWHKRAYKIHQLHKSLNKLIRKLCYAENKQLARDLYPYVWDIRGAVSLLSGFLKWLSWGSFPHGAVSYIQGNYTWFSKGWKEAYMSGDQEPWVFRGGLTADLQRLVPVDNSNDLFSYKIPDMLPCKIYNVRPFFNSDTSGVFELVRKIYYNNLDHETALTTNLLNVIGDKTVGHFLNFCHQTCFVIEDIETNEIIGYGLSAVDAKNIRMKLIHEWTPHMIEKYFRTDKIMHPLYEEIKSSFIDYIPEPIIPDCVINNHPSCIDIGIKPGLDDCSAEKRILTLILAALRTNGCFGAHIRIENTNKFLQEQFVRLGFTEITGSTVSPNYMYYGRMF